MQNDNRNLIVFVVLTLVFLVGYQTFVLAPMQRRREAEQQRAAAAQAAAAKAGITLAPNGEPVVVYMPRAKALAATPRARLQTPSLSGSISLKGARIDDLFLCGSETRSPPCYRETVAANSPPQELLRPAGAENAYYTVNGWTGANLQGLPDETTNWTATSAGALTPDHPLDLSYAAPQGLIFHRRIAVDRSYLLTITDEVVNQGTAPATLAPYASVQRRGVPADLGKTATEGAIGMFDGVLKEVKYPKWKKDGEDDFTTTGGWLGITDKYWMTTFIPDQSEPLNVQFRVRPVGGIEDYETAYVGKARTLAPGGRTVEVTRLFAGAKVVKTLEAYGAALHTPNFDKAVDWGILEVLIKPLFQILDFYAGLIGNFGLAILALTLTIRVLLFPIFNASYAMSTKMKKVQPQMKALQEKHKNDPQALQKEMMALYAREKINPVTGCIPMLLPLPVFYALINMFRVTIEMRHASFGWIKDLSAPDPTTIWNLFGLIPWDPFANGIVQTILHLPFVGGIAGMVFHLGAWPIIYAVTMWLSQITGPPMTGVDPMQQRMIRWMPWVFMFLFAQYSVGLVIYWSFSSVFTFFQQYVLMRRFKVENPIDDFLARLTAPKAAG
ncbi:MAG: membrane protein insertase YidC [Caulobacteraceae bacterium]|nr:membrane protein insertase YidC [Caulobacteraceae bacterium]